MSKITFEPCPTGNFKVLRDRSLIGWLFHRSDGAYFFSWGRDLNSPDLDAGMFWDLAEKLDELNRANGDAIERRTQACLGPDHQPLRFTSTPGIPESLDRWLTDNGVRQIGPGF